MKITCLIVSVALALVALPPISAVAGAPAENDRSGVAVQREASVGPAGVIAAIGPPTVVVPEPYVLAAHNVPHIAPVTPDPQVDPSSDGFAAEGEAAPCKCPGDPVATHLTAAGSGDRCCPHCGVSHSCQCRAPGLRGWWLSRAKPCLQYSHWGYADLFEEPPAGAALYAHKRVQVMLAMRARLALYRYDFYDEATGKAAELNPHGQQRLTSIARISHCFGLQPICIEPVPERPELNDARRDHVLEQLQQSSFAVPDEWVVVARPDAPELAGEEAVEIHTNMLKQTVSGPKGSSGSGQTSGISVGVLGTEPAGGR
jgi:hypothetical protein